MRALNNVQTFHDGVFVPMQLQAHLADVAVVQSCVHLVQDKEGGGAVAGTRHKRCELPAVQRGGENLDFCGLKFFFC